MSARRLLVRLGATASLTVGIALPATALQPHVAHAYPVAVATVLDAHEHVFQSFGANENTVVVTSTTDGSTRVIEGQYGASGMALSADGSLLYIALTSGDAISVVDASTATEVRRIDTGTASCPLAVAPTSTAVWFIDSCVDSGRFDRELRSVSLAEPPTLSPASVAVGVGATELRVAERVAVSWAGSDVTVVNITDASAPQATTFAPDPGRPVRDAAISNDGSRLWVGSANALQEWSLPALTLTRTLASGESGGLAVSPDESLLLSALRIFAADGLRRTVHTSLTRIEARVFRGDSLYIVGDGGRVWRVPAPGSYDSTVTLDQPAGALPIDVAHAITGSLDSRLAIPEGQTVSLTRVVGATWTPAGTATVSGGRFEVTDTPRTRGLVSYVVHWVGDETHVGAAGWLDVMVIGLTPALTARADRTSYNCGERAAITVHVPTALTDKRVSLSGYDINISGGANSSGVFTATTRGLAYNVNVAVSTQGDSRYEPGRTTVRLNVRACIRSTLLDAYKTTATDGYYHATRGARMAVVVNDGTVGLTGTLETQVFVSGAWRAYTKRTGIAVTRGQVTVAYAGPKTAGTLARMRFITAATPAHLTTAGPWRVLRYTA